MTSFISLTLFYKAVVLDPICQMPITSLTDKLEIKSPHYNEKSKDLYFEQVCEEKIIAIII